MSATTMDATRQPHQPEASHPFERAGFGKGPYRFQGHERKVYVACQGAPTQPGSSCDHCMTPIMDVFWLRSADGIRFKVGCDCIRKAAKEGDDYPLQTLAAKLIREQARKVRHAREAKQVAEFRETMSMECHRLAALPSPHKAQADKGQSAWEHARWMDRHAGATGRIATLKWIRKILQESQAVPK